MSWLNDLQAIEELEEATLDATLIATRFKTIFSAE